MSTNLIDDMTENEAKELLNRISDVFNIGGKARSASIILTNVENSSRRSSCLFEIESHHIANDDEENSLLNWGESPKEYIETYKKILSA